nr:hypothetical protein CFP56_32321 [Quercus suber]
MHRRVRPMHIRAGALLCVAASKGKVILTVRYLQSQDRSWNSPHMLHRVSEALLMSREKPRYNGAAWKKNASPQGLHGKPLEVDIGGVYVVEETRFMRLKSP